VRVLFVGINPGVRSSLTGHHFAGFSNRFWKLLFDARLVPEPITYVDDGRLPEWGYGSPTSSQGRHRDRYADA
jgi:TDG/mug DNA glycosylase family protein